MATDSLRNIDDRFSEVIDRGEHPHERVICPRNGRRAAGIIGTNDLERLEETLDILGNTNTVKALLEPETEIANGGGNRP